MPPRLGMSQLGGGLRHHRPLPARRARPLPWEVVVRLADRNAGDQRYADAVQLLRSASEMAAEGLETLDQASLFAAKVLLGCAFVPGLPMAIDLGKEFPGLLSTRTYDAMARCVKRFLPPCDWLDALVRVGLKGDGGVDLMATRMYAPAGYLQALGGEETLLLLLAACWPWPVAAGGQAVQMLIALLTDLAERTSPGGAPCTAALAALPLAWGQGVAPATPERLRRQLAAFLHVRLSVLLLSAVRGMEAQACATVPELFMLEVKAMCGARAAACLAPAYLPALAAAAAVDLHVRDGRGALGTLFLLGDDADSAQDDYTAMWAHGHLMDALARGFAAPAGQPPAPWTPALVAPHARRVLQAEGWLRVYGGARLLGKYAAAAVDLLCDIEKNGLEEGSLTPLQPNPQPPHSTAVLWAQHMRRAAGVGDGGGGSGPGIGRSGSSGGSGSGGSGTCGIGGSSGSGAGGGGGATLSGMPRW